jgi:tetratricopeptide (TPR) repeat protein
MGDSAANRPAPAASGTLGKTPFLHLVLYALEQKLSGTMELFSPDRQTAVVLFADGKPAKVRTSEPVAYLGRVLQELGFLSEEQLSRSLADLARQKTAGPCLHGQVLLASGAVDADRLRAGLVDQIGRKLRHVAVLPPDTAYAYFEGFDGLRGWGGDEVSGTDPFPYLRGMLRENVLADPMKAALDRVSASPLRLARDSEVARLGLPKEEAAAIELLKLRPLRLTELGKAGRLDEGSVEQLGYLLLLTKQVDVLRPTETVPPARGRSSRPAAPPSSVSAIPARPVTTPPVVAAPKAPATPTSPPAAPPASLTGELAERWREITDRAATIDRADYFMMLELARDATREQVESAFLALAKRWHPDRLPPELAPVRDACSRVFGRMSEARSTLADDEHRARYMRLLAEGSGTPEMQESVAKVLEAARDFQKAEIRFKRNDLVEAETYCRQAMEADPTQPDYLAMLAWLTALKPESQSVDKTLECIKMLDRAVAMSERCERALFSRAMLYKRLGKGDLATKDFKRVVDLNPRNIDAAREVRLHQMRGGRPSVPPPAARGTPAGKAEEPAKGGLFGRLFKKT